MVKEILKEMRGKLSQERLSRKLGYEFNQVYRWESGKTRLMWSDFVDVCRARKIQLAPILQGVFRYSGASDDGRLLLLHLIGGRALSAVARDLGVSRFVLQRWAGGQTQLPFSVVLDLAKHHAVLEIFVGEFADISRIPQIAHVAEQRKIAEKLFLDHPTTGMVLSLLKLQTYRAFSTHRSDWLREQAGISAREEEEILAQAARAGLIRKSKGKYTVMETSISTRAYPEADRLMREFWMARGREIARSPVRPDDFFGFAILALDAEGERKLREATVHFANTINAIALECTTSADRVRTITLQSFAPPKQLS